MKVPYFPAVTIRNGLIGWHCIALCLAAFVTVGCKRNETAATSTGDSSATNTAAEVSPAAYTTQTNFSLPFQGVIKAREQRDLLLNTTEITYTIGKGKIRRDKVQKAPLGKVVDIGLGTAGIICDVEKDEVLLHRSGIQGRFFVRMTLAEFRELITKKTFASEVSWHPLDRKMRPDIWRHAGTFFVDVPQPMPKGHTVSIPEARSVGGLPCDLLTIKEGNAVWEVSHCQLIKVDRELLELVELRIPSEVTGFPCLMRQLTSVPTRPPDKEQSTALQLLQKGISLAANVAEKALKREIELLEITESIPPDSAFSLGAGFEKLADLAELNLKFAAPKGSGHGGDDWD